MKQPVLVLNSDYQAHRVTDWKTAFIQIYSKGEDSAYQVASYDNIVYDSMSRPYYLPAVIVLKNFMSNNNKTCQYSKRNIYLRDRYLCQYCFKQLKPAEATIDHVIPKSQKLRLPTNIKLNSFENCVTACFDCNGFKRDRTPQQAGMRLRIVPRSISRAQKVYLDIVTKGHVPEEWKPYLTAHEL